MTSTVGQELSKGFNMSDEIRLRRLAILIDADNTSPRIAAGLFEEIAKFGEASVRRIYGDFSSPRLKSWIEILQKHAIDPYQQFAYTSGKNASDIATSDSASIFRGMRSPIQSFENALAGVVLDPPPPAFSSPSTKRKSYCLTQDAATLA